MKKIISLFQRNYDGDRLVRNELVPGAEWVVAGDGVATRKLDGTCCLWSEGKLWKRYELKAGKPAPPWFMSSQEQDRITGNVPGWVPVGDGPEDRWHREALSLFGDALMEGCSYELCGPRINGNPERYPTHVLMRHGMELLEECPRSFEGLFEYLCCNDIEGVVWWHPDGRMVKIKGKDFGLRRGKRRGTVDEQLADR